MTDYQEQIESERGKFKELLLKIPGFKGYIELEDRRTADQMLRDVVANRYQDQLDRLTGIQTEFEMRRPRASAAVPVVTTIADRLTSRRSEGLVPFMSL